MTVEPHGTALLLAVGGILLALSAIVSRASQRFAVPVALVFLGVGMLAGREGFGRIVFEDYAFAFRLGMMALVLILFDGGLNTPMTAVREAARPAAVLATAGVAGTAALVAGGAHVLGFAWPQAALLGAVVSSTDAAAVFSVLRGSGIPLKRRVGTTLEIESGINDPLAFLLTTSVALALASATARPMWRHAADALVEIVLGGGIGVALGYGGRALLGRVRLPAGGLYPALTLGLAFLAYGVPTLLGGSGLLAVYVAAVILGNGTLPFRAGLLRVHDALAWLSQIVMFLVLGLLVVPTRLLDVATIGIALALFLAVVARPVVVTLCLLPFRAYTLREIVYVSWVGLRGAVPIILAIFPVLVGAPGATGVFDVVFFIVVANALVPGASVSWLTRRLDLTSDEPPPAPALLQIESMLPLEGELVSFHVDEALAVTGVPLRELPFPEGASAVLVVRGRELLAPKGRTVLQPGDHVYLFTRPADRAFLQLMFGRPEEG